MEVEDMKPVIINRSEILEALFKGNEVICVSFNQNNKPVAKKMTGDTVENAISEAKSLDNGSSFFVELKKDTEEQPPVEDNKNTETDKQPEDVKEEENV